MGGLLIDDMRTLRNMLAYRLPIMLGLVRHHRRQPRMAGEVWATMDDTPYRVPLNAWQPCDRHIAGLYYTARGMACEGLRLDWQFSIETPRLGQAARAVGQRLLRMLRRGAERLPRGTILGMCHPNTYGDWFRQGLLPLATRRIQPPLVLPAMLYEKPYVKRDLAALGIEVVVPGPEGLIIDDALALEQDGDFYLWRAGHIDAIRQLFEVAPRRPRSGSLLYLSREGERCESSQRTYPSLAIEQAIGAIGGRVVRTAGLQPADYRHLAEDVETVVADHGSAMCNLAWWRTRRVVEIRSVHFNNYFITLAASAGVSQHDVIGCVDRSPKDVAAAVVRSLETGKVKVKEPGVWASRAL